MLCAVVCLQQFFSPLLLWLLTNQRLSEWLKLSFWQLTCRWLISEGKWKCQNTEQSKVRREFGNNVVQYFKCLLIRIEIEHFCQTFHCGFCHFFLLITLCAVLFNCSNVCGPGTWPLCVWALLLLCPALLCSNAIFMLSAFACCKLNVQEAAAAVAANMFIYATRRRFTWNAATCAQPASQPAIEAARQHHINIAHTPHIVARFAKALT